MVLLIIIPFLNGYFIGNINPTFSDIPVWLWVEKVTTSARLLQCRIFGYHILSDPITKSHYGYSTGHMGFVSNLPIGSMYGIYNNIGGILMANVTIYSIHGSYGLWNSASNCWPKKHLMKYSLRISTHNIFFANNHGKSSNFGRSSPAH